MEVMKPDMEVDGTTVKGAKNRVRWMMIKLW